MATRERKLGPLLGSVLFVAALAPGRAAAFCRTTTVMPPAGAEGCPAEGVPLFLPSQCLPYRLRTVESTVIPNAVLSEKLARAFAAWTAPNATCVPRVSGIELAPVGDVPIIAYSPGSSNQSVLGVAATWSTRAAGQLTAENIIFSSTMGEILDTDVEINPDVSWSFTESPSADAFDLQTAMTHAVGHMLGFAHSPDPSSVMSASAIPGEVKRVPTADDLAGMCSVYAVPRAPCVLTAGSPDARCRDTRILNGCATSKAPGPANVSMLAVASCLVVLRCVRRRQRPRT